MTWASATTMPYVQFCFFHRLGSVFAKFAGERHVVLILRWGRVEWQLGLVSEMEGVGLMV